MLLLVSCALLVLYRISCFLALKYHVLLATVVFSCLQSIHMVASPKHYKMNCVCFFYCITNNVCLRDMFLDYGAAKSFSVIYLITASRFSHINISTMDRL
jgi:hypothetical protein